MAPHDRRSKLWVPICRSSARSDETSTITVGDGINAAVSQSMSSSDPLELFKQAALTFQTPPAIYQRQRLGLEDLPKVAPATLPSNSVPITTVAAFCHLEPEYRRFSCPCNPQVEAGSCLHQTINWIQAAGSELTPSSVLPSPATGKPLHFSMQILHVPLPCADQAMHATARTARQPREDSSHDAFPLRRCRTGGR